MDVKPADDDQERPDIGDLTRELVTRQQRFESAVARALEVDAIGLAAMDYLILNGSATPTELAHNLEVSTAAMTLVLDRLEAAEHISRSPHPSDRRKVVISPAKDSIRAAFSHVQPLIDGMDKMVNAMTPAERAVVTKFLADLNNLYDEAKRAIQP